MMQCINCTWVHLNKRATILSLICLLFLSMSSAIVASDIHNSVSVVFTGDVVALPQARTVYAWSSCQ